MSYGETHSDNLLTFNIAQLPRPRIIYYYYFFYKTHEIVLMNLEHGLSSSEEPGYDVGVQNTRR